MTRAGPSSTATAATPSARRSSDRPPVASPYEPAGDCAGMGGEAAGQGGVLRRAVRETCGSTESTWSR